MPSMIFAAIVKASSGNVYNFVFSTSTSSRTIKKVRTEMFVKVQKDFKVLVNDEFFSVDSDGKLIQDGRDYCI